VVPLLFERQLHLTAGVAEDTEGIFGCARLSPATSATSAVQFFFLLLGRREHGIDGAAEAASGVGLGGELFSADAGN
jgi:hypothetical protein